MRLVPHILSDKVIIHKIKKMPPKFPLEVSCVCFMLRDFSYEIRLSFTLNCNPGISLLIFFSFSQQLCDFPPCDIHSFQIWELVLV